MNKILTVNELQSFKDIGEKPDAKKVNPIIEQAQITELKDLLGQHFYFDVLSNLEASNYQDLLSGSSFTCNGISFYQDGLKALLADYFMSKYVLQVNTNFTPFGATVKQSESSLPADRNSLKDISTQQLQLAGSRWETIKMYLDNNTILFPNWPQNNTSLGGSSSERIFRIRKI
jgi:hypothetical protein